jgi:thymidylate synthase (FAD)
MGAGSVRVHLEPKVILLARPSIDWGGVDDFLGEYGPGTVWHHAEDDPDAELVVELAGRACYGSFGDRQGRIGAAAYVGHILESGHGSVLEHAQWTFAVCRASRGYTHQQVRHRAGFAYSQESQHFTHYSDGGARGTQEPAVCLTGIEGEALARATTAAARAVEEYERVWEQIRASFPADARVKKVVCGAARLLLPTATESRLVMSANARALRHVIELRGTEENVLEVRLVAVGLMRIMKAEAPAIFADFAEAPGRDGRPIAVSVHRKV